MTNLHLLKRLRNQVYPVAFRKITTVIEEEQFEVEDVQTSFNHLKVAVDNLAGIKNKTRLSPLTRVINDLKSQRHQYLSSMRGVAKANLKTPSESVRTAAITIYTWLNREQEFMAGSTLDKQSQTVFRMMDDLRNESELPEALATLGLTETMDTLATVSGKVERNDAKRAKELTAKKKRTKELRNKAYESLKVLCEVLEHTIKLEKGDAQTHYNYLEEIEDIVKYYAGTVASGVTRRKNADEENAETDEPTDATEADGEQTESKETSGNGKPAMAGGKKTYGVVTLNGVDVQRGEPNESEASTDVTDGSETMGNVSSNADVPATDQATGNGEMGTGSASTQCDIANTTPEASNGASVEDDDSDRDHGDAKISN